MTRLTLLQREILTALAGGAVIDGASCLDYAIDGRPIACRTMTSLVVRDLVDCVFDFKANIHGHRITELGLAALGRASDGQGDDDDGRAG